MSLSYTAVGKWNQTVCLKIVGQFLINWSHAHAQLLQSCPTLCDPMDCSPPGSSVHGILQARILEWVVMPSFRGSSWPWNRIRISQRLLHWRQILYQWATWEVYDRHKLFYHQTIPLFDIYPSNLFPEYIKKKCITNTHNKMKEFKGLCWAKHTRHKRVHIVFSNQS